MKSAGAPRALIAEDDYFVAEEICERLIETGYQIAGVARDGAEAVNMTCALHPDIVLMDIKMPKMDGLMASREIQKRCPAPVVVLTAYDDLDLARVAATSGVGAFLVKPPVTTQLNHAILIARARFADMQQMRRLNEELAREMEERKKAEAAQQRLDARAGQAQKLKSLGVMAAGVAHDFNNLLQAILGYIELAKREAPSESKEQKYLSEAELASRRAAHISSMMLAYVGHGKRTLEMINLAELIRTLKDALENIIAPGAMLRFCLPDKLATITGDSDQIQQVIFSLVANASEALEGKEGIIAVSASTMHCSRQWLNETYLNEQLPEGLYVCLQVSDTGCGIDAKIRDSIFDPFFSTKFAGRGMGLAAALGIIRGHRGAIKAESEPGKGSTFTVVFPVVAEQDRGW